MPSDQLRPLPDAFSDADARELLSRWTVRAAEEPPVLVRRETVQAMMCALCLLKKRHRLALRSRFGLGNREPQTLDELGVTLGGVSRERGRQILLSAMAALRSRLILDHFPGRLRRQALDALVRRAFITTARERPPPSGDLHRTLQAVTAAWPAVPAWAPRVDPREIQRIEKEACRIRGGCSRPNDMQSCVWCGSPGEATSAA